jgi:hypothetical protein
MGVGVSAAIGVADLTAAGDSSTGGCSGALGFFTCVDA